MSGINGYGGNNGANTPLLPAANTADTAAEVPTFAGVPILSATDATEASGGKPDIKTYDLTVNGPLPDPGAMSGKELYDALADLVEKSDSDELKAAFAGDEPFVLELTNEFGEKLSYWVDPMMGWACGRSDDPSNGPSLAR